MLPAFLSLRLALNSFRFLVYESENSLFGATFPTIQGCYKIASGVNRASGSTTRSYLIRLLAESLIVSQYGDGKSNLALLIKANNY